MPEYRPSRGVPLPSLWQALVIAAFACAGYLLWQELSGTAGARPEVAGDDPIQKMQTVEALADQGPAGVPALVALLSSPDRKMQKLALYGLGRLGAEAEPGLDAVRERLSDEDPDFRGNALAAFSFICNGPDDLWATATRLLDDPERKVREAAAKILEGTSPRIVGAQPDPIYARRRRIPSEELRHLVPIVQTMAHAERPETRGLVIRIVTRRDRAGEDPAVTDMLRTLEEDGDPAVREAAIESLVARGAATSAEIRQWLLDADPRVVASALQGIEHLGLDKRHVLPELLMLVEQISNEQLPALIPALHSLQHDARPAVPALLRRLQQLEIHDYSPSGGRSRTRQRNVARENSVRFAWVPVLQEIGAEPAELMTMLKPFLSPTPDHFDRQAAELLARFDPDEARRYAAQLLKNINRDETALTRQALQVISGLGPAARDAVPMLIRLIEEGSRKPNWIEYGSIEALGGMGPDAADAVPCLVRILASPRTDAAASQRHTVVVQALGRIGPVARSAVPELLEILELPEPRRQMMEANAMPAQAQPYFPPFGQTIAALGLIAENSEQVRSCLRRQQTIRRNGQHRHAALKSLMALSGNSGTILPDLIRSLEDESSDVRLLAAAGVGRTGGDRRAAIGELVNALNDEDPWVASAAALSLREIGSTEPAAVASLRKIYSDARNRVANGVRAPRRAPEYSNIRFEPGHYDLAHMSLAEAAGLALDAIAPSME